MWQDWVIAVTLWVFVAAMLPTIFHPTNKPALSTSLLTTVGNFIMAYAFATLGLWNGALAALAIATAWAIVSYQRYRLDTSQREHR